MEINRVNSPLAASAIATTGTAENKLQATPELAQAVTAVNGAKLFGHDSELTFAMDRETRRMVIRLVDRKTRTVVRQFPPEYMLRLAEEVDGKTG